MNDIVKEFEKEFAELKKELKFKVSLEELDDIFFLRDYFAKEGFVSNKLSRQLARRITELFLSWGQYLHGVLYPNPGNIVNMIESQTFDEVEKAEMIKLIDRIMSLSAENSVIGLSRDVSKEGAFIDKAVALWKEINPTLIKYMKKEHARWEERLKSKPQKEDKELRRMYG